MVKDHHVIEALGKTKVVIENGEVVSVGEPLVEYCPLFDKIDNAKKLDKDYIKWNMEKRIREFGMCTKERVVKMPDMMSFGISEILKTNRELGQIDCVVGVCEGVGTLLITDPEIIQGVGGRVSALISTTPIPEVIEKVGKENAMCARFALLELVNLHDDSLEFEAIHRVIFDVDTDNFISELKTKYNLTEGENDVSFEIVTKDGTKSYIIENPDFNLTVGCIQSFIDSYLSKNEGEVDYIHGEDVVKNLSQKENNVGIILKSMLKTDLFKTVILDGALPRKTFSMGEACDKRFYLEGRKIK